jgi:hypothetical protein
MSLPTIKTWVDSDSSSDGTLTAEVGRTLHLSAAFSTVYLLGRLVASPQPMPAPARKRRATAGGDHEPSSERLNKRKIKTSAKDAPLAGAV